ncbi:MAG: vWA domain-containing protein [Ignavibacteria bacterium]
MKKTFIILFLISISLLPISCKIDVTGPVGPVITAINTNGTLTQINRTTVKSTVFVTDQNNNPVLGLTSSDIIAKLSWISPSPDSVTGTVSLVHNISEGKDIAAVLTMDYSESMWEGQIECMKNGVKTYVSKVGNDDQTEIIKFDHRVIVAQTFTNNKQLLYNAIDSNYMLYGSTALYQSIYQGLNDVKNFNPTTEYIRCLVAFTDGGENASQISRETMLNYALINGLPVYTVGLYFDSTYFQQEIRDLKNIADTTGGSFYYLKSDTTCNSTITAIYNKIASQIIGSYTLTITWPSASLPPAGTIVKCVIITTYSGHTNSFVKSYSLQ